MSVQADQVTVGTSATSVIAAGVAGLRAVVRNAGSTSVFLGPAGVTTTTGYELAAGDSVEVPVNGGGEVFGVVATGTEPVHVLAA